MNKRLLKFGRQLTPYKARGLGVFPGDNKIYLLYQSSASSVGFFQIDHSPNGLDFGLFSDSAFIKKTNGKKEDVSKCKDFRVSKVDNKYFLSYKVTHRRQSYLSGAVSADLINWEELGTISTPAETGMLVPGYQNKGEYIAYFGEKSIIVATSPDLVSWRILGNPISKLVDDSKGHKIKIAEAKVTGEGILLIYHLLKGKKPKRFSLKVALFDKDNPNNLLWDKVIWDQKSDFEKKGAKPLGVILVGNKLISYWQAKDGEIFTISFPYFKSTLAQIKPVFISPAIKKFIDNPILAPIVHHFWESKAVFNPTAFYDEGNVHLVYRAVGDDDVSTLGYATSKDGFNIDKRYQYPIYVPTQPFEGSEFIARSHSSRVKKYIKPVSSPYVSGPGVGGCEDPRITKLEGRIYMTYAAFNGYEQARSAFSSISADDFHNSKWNWTKPTLMTAKPTVWGTGGKNACFLSEKINGKYVIMHRFWPNILIDYVDDLEFGEDKKFLRTGKSLDLPDDMWDRGRFSPGGAIPLETDSGWVVLFGIPSKADKNRYEIGLRLLDKGNTKKTLAEYKDICEPDGTEFLEHEGIIAPRAQAWDSAKIGIGAPPIRTDDGWLLIYQAVGYHDSSKYKAGAMLLDLKNPAKVLYRSSRPILEPNESYENNGHKAGVVYPCGAVIKNDNLFIYYGGADTVSCVAYANIHEFLYQLKGAGTAALETQVLH